MRILSLDIATNTGWARWSAGANRPVAGVETFRGDVYAKVGAFERWVIASLVADEISHLFVEQFVPVMNGKTSFDVTETLLSMNVIAGVVAHRRNVSFERVPPQVWRRHFIGAGRAPKGTTKPTEWLKARAVQRCRELGWDIPKHDAAEAAGLLDYARARLNPAYGVASAELFRGAA